MSSAGEPRPPDGRGERPVDPGALPHVYNPYAGVVYPTRYPVPAPGAPSGGPPAPVRRPGVLHLALLLLVVATVPYLLSGLLMALAAEQVVAAAPAEQLEPVRAAGIDPVRVVRGGGIALVVIGAVYVLLAVLAWSGRRWARALVATTTVGFALMVAVALVGAGSGVPLDAGSLLVVVGPAALAAAGVLLLFGRAARAWFDRPRR